MLERYSSEFLFVPGKLGTANFFPFPDNIKGLLGGSVVKNPPATQEMSVRSLGRKDNLEMEMSTHSSILSWRTPWTVEPGGPQSMGSQRIKHDLATDKQRKVLCR